MTTSGVENRRIENIATYRCACGELLEIRQQSAECNDCGRCYDSEYLAAVEVDTISIDSDLLPARLHERPEVDPFVGQRLGHFKILWRIGDGGMGAVYRALDESLQRDVALKVIHSEPGESESADIERLFEEARAQARVNHPHVVHVYYVGMENKTPFLAMELVGNRTLADRIREEVIPFQDIVRYAIQITRALGRAAEYDIVHGDIKPSNVLLADNTTGKLSDFGLARRLSAPSAVSSRVSGTPDYMPPESTRGGSVDHRGDMYSLGVTLFQMTFGRLPYTAVAGDDVNARLKLHREAPVEFPERWPAQLPETWKFLLARLLSKEPDGRYASFAELEDELKRVAPIDMPIANSLLRGLAWGIDAMLLIVGLIVIQVAVGSIETTFNPDAAANATRMSQFGLFSMLLNALIGGGFLSAIALLQAHWGSTTGKRFLQIRIVDQHGLKPRPRVLAARSAFQFSFAWWFVISGPLQFVGLDRLATALGYSVAVILLAEIGCVLLRRGRSLHDIIFATRVVLDATPESDRIA